MVKPALKVVPTMPDHNLHVGLLEKHLEALSEKDQGFAYSLLGQLKSRKMLSDKQWQWVVTLSERATNPAEKTLVAVGNFKKVITLFEKANENLRRPKIRLRLPDGQPIVLSMTGQGSKHKGTVQVTDGGRFGSNLWYGRVSIGGTWEPGYRIDKELAEVVQDFLSRFAKNPAKIAAAHGKLTGSCCFCNLPLTDPRSTKVGYGKVCAENYDLEWG